MEMGNLTLVLFNIFTNFRKKINASDQLKSKIRSVAAPPPPPLCVMCIVIVYVSIYNDLSLLYRVTFLKLLLWQLHRGAGECAYRG